MTRGSVREDLSPAEAELQARRDEARAAVVAALPPVGGTKLGEAVAADSGLERGRAWRAMSQLAAEQVITLDRAGWVRRTSE